MSVKSNSRTLPNCARCSNHGIKIKLRAHKRFCAYRYCNCEKCKLTVERQRDMALQTAMRRAHAQDESRVLLQGQIPHEAKVPMPIIIKNEFVRQEIDDVEIERPDSGFDPQEFNDDSEFSTSANIQSEEPMPLEIPNHQQFTEEYQDSGTNSQHDLIMKAEHIVAKFNCVHETMPLMYALVKSTMGNLNLSEQLLNEGKSVIQEHVKKNNLNMFDGKPMRRY